MSKNLKNGSFALALDTLPTLWCDRKRILGMPISFTKYTLNANKLLLNTGFINLKEEEILLYRIRDISFSQSFWDRLFRVGNLTLTSSDNSHPTLEIKHVKKPRSVKEALSKCIEEDRRQRKIRATELMDDTLPFEQDGDELMETDEQVGL
ncbi:MAG: PH domain-containing protein [Faecalibacterium sp.]